MNIKTKIGESVRKRWFYLLLSFLVILSFSCDGDSNSNSTPIDLEGINAKFLSDISYGSDPLQTFDIFMPASNNSTPLVIFIHGGGFYTGDKDWMYDPSEYPDPAEDFIKIVNGFLSKGIAVANINYRLINILGDCTGMIKSLKDSTRCLQYIRYNATTYNIDKNRIALMGESAGAGTCLWIGLQDDMADNTNVDPILRESTRVSAIAAIETQATYDLVKWDSFLSELGITIGGFITGDDTGMMYFYLCALYGMTPWFMPDSDDIYTQLGGVTDYRAKVDFLSFMDSSDPELFISNTMIPVVPDSLGLQEVLHHPLHGKKVMDEANVVGIPNVTYLSMTATGANTYSEDVIGFMDRKLNN